MTVKLQVTLLLLTSALLAAIGGCVTTNQKPAPIVPENPNWQKLDKIYKQFYKIDEQNFREFSCIINAPDLQNAVKQVRGEFASFSDKISVSDTLDQYKLVYDKVGGPHISNPDISIHYDRYAKIANPELFKEGEAHMNEGFRKMVEGTNSIVLNALKVSPSPKSSEFNLLYFNTTGEVNNFSLIDKSGNVQITESISPRLITKKSHFGDHDISVNEVLVPASNMKMLVSSDDIQITSPTSTEHINRKIDYQKIGNMILPIHISVTMQRNSFDSNINTKMDVTLTDCKVIN